MRSGMRMTALLVGLCLSLAAAACREEHVEEVRVARPVKILTVGIGDSGERFEYPGTISAARHSDMAFEVAGKMTAFPVNEGQAVSEGDVLAQIDARDYEAVLASAQADLNKARADYRRGRKLREEDPGAIAQVTLDTYKRALDVAAAAYRTAEKGVEDTVLRAPFSGRVARKLVEDFANVRAKEPVLVLQDDSHLEIDVSVPERDVVWGEPSLSHHERTARFNPVVVVTSIPDRSFPARVKEFSTMADPVTRTFKGTLAFDKPDDVQILPGMTAKAVIETTDEWAGAGTGMRIPASAARTDESGGAFVWVVDPSSMTVRRTEVELGNLSGSQVEIRSGLKAGDQIAISGVHHLREGTQVRRLEK